MTRVQQFTADASHELRSPISFIRLTAEYHLGNSNIDADLQDDLCAIVQESSTATDMLEGLLLLARLDADPPNGESEAVELSCLLQELSLHFAPSLQRRSQELRVEAMVEGRVIIRMQAAHLRRVLVALLDNATKYTPSGGRICIRYEMNDVLLVHIMDTGIGIAREDCERIFDRFFRVDTARSSTVEGVGLGLSIAKRLMEQAGGTISLISEVNRGTTMSLAFPRRIASNSAL
jgi:signal transduction histidine kinase